MFTFAYTENIDYMFLYCENIDVDENNEFSV